MRSLDQQPARNLSAPDRFTQAAIDVLGAKEFFTAGSGWCRLGREGDGTRDYRHLTNTVPASSGKADRDFTVVRESMTRHCEGYASADEDQLQYVRSKTKASNHGNR